MRDPHIVALYYRLETAQQLAFKDPPQVERETATFSLRLTDGELRVALKDHFPTEAAARLEVDPYLQAWEISTALQYGPGAIRFVFDRPEIVDRDPPLPGSARLYASIGLLTMTGMAATLTLTKTHYPDPPDKFVASPDVVAMWNRYRGYLEGRDRITDMAYYCLTTLQQTGARHTVSENVLDTLSRLATMVGDVHTLRKRQQGQQLRPHTAAEIAWMEVVVKRMIQRVGEWAGAPATVWPQITLDDFSKL